MLEMVVIVMCTEDNKTQPCKQSPNLVFVLCELRAGCSVYNLYINV